MSFEFLELKEGLIGPLCLVAVAFFVLAMAWDDFRKNKRREEIRTRDRRVLKEEFSAEIINRTELKNTEIIEIEVNLPNGYNWTMKVFDDVDGNERKINSARYGKNGSRRICSVYKGQDMHFLVMGKGLYDSKVIVIPLVT